MRDTRQGNRDTPPPAWLRALVTLLVAGSCSQFAYALHPRKGPFVGYLEMASVGVLILWGVWVLATSRLRYLKGPPWSLWAFLAVAVLSLANATSLKAGAVEVAQYALYFVALYMLFADIADSSGRWLWYALGVGTLVATAVAFVQLLSGAEPIKVAGLTANRNVHSAFLAFALPLVWAWGCSLWPRREAWAVFVLVTLALLTMLGAPHVWIAIVAIAWVSAVLLRPGFWPATTPVVVLVLAANFVSPVHRTCNLEELLNPWETGDVYKLLREVGATEHQPLLKKRWLEWWPGLAMIADNPLLGVGAGNYQLNIGRPDYWGYLPNAKKTEPDTNNLYLVLGGSLGLAGLVAFVAVLVRFTALAVSGARRRDPMMTGLAAALVSLAVANLFTALLVRGVTVAWVAALAAIERAAGGQASEGGQDGPNIYNGAR